MSKQKKKLFIFDVILLLVLVAADQFTKHLAVTKLKNQPDFNIAEGVLSFHYLENHGAAFGVLQDYKTFFVVSALVFLIIVLCVLIKMPDASKYSRLHLLLTMAAAGAMGNLIDRVRLGYVVDFIYIVLIDFPVFNIADMYVTFAAAIITLQVLFVFEEDDLDFLFRKGSGS